MAENKQGKLSIHPYVGGTTRNLIANVIKNGGVDRAHVPSLLATLGGTLATAPLRFLEWALYSRKIKRTAINPSPIFIVGHWRSGTTHLHNVISHDKRFGYLTTCQALFPTCSLVLSRSPALKRSIAELLPEKRMMDNMRLHLDFPQEEEFSVSCLTTSAHHCNHFPRTIRQSFDRYVLMQGSAREKASWKRAYLKVLRKAAFAAGERRLVLKNPYNTARIPELLEMFPDAKFIHIYRNPFNIYVSALHDFLKEAEEMALQEFTEEDFSELCFELYEKLMGRYWQTRDLVPKGNLSEVAYEAFEANPLTEVARIYAELGLTLTADAERDIANYLGSISDYKKNRYTLNEPLARKIAEKWQGFIERMNYAAPRDIAISNDAAWTCKMEY